MAEENTAAEETQEAPKKRTRTTTKKTTGEATTKNETTAKKSRSRTPKHEGVAESVAESLAQLSAETAKKPARRSTRAKAPATIVFSGNEESAASSPEPIVVAPMTSLLFQEPDVTRAVRKRRPAKDTEANEDVQETTESPSSEAPAKRANRKNNKAKSEDTKTENKSDDETKESSEENADETTNENEGTRKRRRGSRGGRRNAEAETESDESATSAEAETEEESTIRRRRRRRTSEEVADEVTAPKGSTRLEAKRQRRKEGREAGRRRPSITESEYLARRESVNREMLIRERDGLNQIAVIEDGVLVEHYVARHTQTSMVGNVYLGRVQNVLPSMEAAFVDIGKGRNAVLYAGEVNWDATGVEPNKPRKIEDALKSGDAVLVQVTKDPIGHKGARLTGQITLAGRHLVLVPNGAMTGISRKLPDRERARLKKILKEVVPSEHGVIVRTAAEGASEDQLRQDVERLTKAWADIEAKSKSTKNAPSLLKGEPELAVRVVRDIFNEDFNKLKISGENAYSDVSGYVEELSPELSDRVEKWESDHDIFHANRVDEQLAKAFDRKVFLPSGGSLVIDRTEAMTVIDVNTGKFTGSGGSLEETVTRNNLEAAEEIVRQLRLRDIGGIIVVDFIDMVLEANRDLVLRRLIECLGRDRTRHQVAEVTSLGLVQMTRKRVGQGLVEAFSTTCEACEGRGYITHDHPVERGEEKKSHQNSQRNQKKTVKETEVPTKELETDPKHEEVKAALASIAAAASSKHEDTKQADSSEEQAVKSKRGRASKANAAVATEAQPESLDEQPSAESDGNSRGKRRVTSSGTITPTSSASSAIMSFPVKKS